MRTPGKRPIRRKRTYDLWANQMAKKWGISRKEFNNHPYDYVSYYNDNPDLAWEHIDNKLAPYQHFPDEYKTVDHPTFSNQSTHSGKISIRNPKGVTGGEWNDAGDAYVLSPEQSRSGWDVGRTKLYLYGEGVSVYSPHGKVLVGPSARKPKSNSGSYRFIPSYASGKDDDPLKTGELWNINGSPYYELNNQMYNSSGSRVQFGAGTESNPTQIAGGPAVVTPSRRQRLDHPLLFNLINAAKMTPEQKEIYYSAKAGLGSERFAEFFGEMTPVGDATDTYRVVDDLRGGRFGDAAIGAVLLAAPNFLERPVRALGRAVLNNRPIRKLKKAYSRLKSPSNWNYIDSVYRDYVDAIDKIAQNYGNKASEYLVPVSSAERAAFLPRYKWALDRGLIPDILAGKIPDWINGDREQLKSLFLHNPEYFTHVLDMHITDPLSQQAVDSFIDRQLKSIRGVAADNIDEAREYLTSTQKGRRMPGGDRLHTDGGLYVSNNPNISDSFKNPVGKGRKNGYVAILKEHDTIDRTLPIEDQLRQLRQGIEFEGWQDPLYGNDYVYNNLDRSGINAVESEYVGNASRGTGGQERAYFPAEDGTIQHPVEIEDITEYPALTDQHGRWGLNIEPLVDTRLFVGKQLNPYEDFIHRARAFLLPRVRHNKNIRSRVIEEHKLIARERLRKRGLLLDKLNNRRDIVHEKILPPLYTTGVLLGMTTPPIALIRSMRSEPNLFDYTFNLPYQVSDREELLKRMRNDDTHE